MYKHILVPTDGSALSLKAMRAATRLAAPLRARITVLYVIPPFTPPMSSEGMMFHVNRSIREYDRGMRKHSDKALTKARSLSDGIDCDTTAVSNQRPWEGIIASAAKKKCDLIVMASHGRGGVASLLLGSETQKVLAHSKTPVLVCR